MVCSFVPTLQQANKQRRCCLFCRLSYSTVQYTLMVEPCFTGLLKKGGSRETFHAFRAVVRPMDTFESRIRGSQPSFVSIVVNSKSSRFQRIKQYTREGRRRSSNTTNDNHFSSFIKPVRLCVYTKRAATTSVGKTKRQESFSLFYPSLTLSLLL